MTRKYHVASWAMVARILGTLRSAVLDFAAKIVINENARKSGVCISPQGSVEWTHYSCKSRVILTHHIGVGCLYTQFVGSFAV